MDSKFFSLALVFICLTGNIEEIVGQTAGDKRPLDQFPTDKVQAAIDFLSGWLGAYEQATYKDCYDVNTEVTNVGGYGQDSAGISFDFTFNLEGTLTCNGNENCMFCVSKHLAQSCIAKVHLDQQNPPAASFLQVGDRPTCND